MTTRPIEGQGKKTHEQFLRVVERKDDVPKARETERRDPRTEPAHRSELPNQAARQSEAPVSRGGMNQESHHNKHNDKGQSGHKPQKHDADG